MNNNIRPRSCWLEINLDALAGNLELINSAKPDGADVLCVVKADAYGHGAEIVSHHLGDNGVDFFGVATLEEAIKLRHHGLDEDILIMGHMATYNVDELFEYDLTPMIYSYRLLHAINDAANQRDVRKQIHLKTDTGMGRLGLKRSDLSEFLDRVNSLDHVVLDGLATHFAEAGTDPEYTRGQIDDFKAIRSDVETAGLDPTYRHVMNSAALFGNDSDTGNLVRPGITLYGYSPDPAIEIDGLEPVMEVRCKMADYKRVEPGHGISYGRMYQPEEPTWIGVLPVGYADGYSRVLSGQAHVLKDGERRDVLGNICMDMAVIRCRESDDPEGIVTLMGRDGDEELWADTLADWQGTISYEILSGFSQRLPRLYLEDNRVIAQKSEQGITSFDSPLPKQDVIR